MAVQTKYTYTISTSTLNGVVDIDTLTTEITTSSVSIALDYISTFQDTVDIYFKDILSSADQGVLGSVLSTHTGVKAVSSTRTDTSGRMYVRPVAAISGASMYYAGPQFTAAKTASGSWERFNNQTYLYEDKSAWVDVKLYDAAGAVTTVETAAVTTVMDITLPVDVELVGGAISIPAVLPGVGDWKVFAYGVPGVSAASGGSVPFVENIQLNGFYEAEDIILDGRVTKLMQHLEAVPTSGIWLNTIRIIVKHPSGLNPSITSTDVAVFQLILDSYATGIGAV